MARKKIKEGSFEVDIPETFNGEITLSAARATTPIAPIDRDFANGEVQILKEKINEIISKIQ